MKNNWIFDQEPAEKINLARMDTLKTILFEINKHIELNSALDVGCGIGKFSNFLSNLNFEVTAVDGREDNVIEAKNRYPNIKFLTYNVEEPEILKLGKFDLVLCFGLLYHLENPFKAIRNLHALTGKVLIIESMISSEKKPMASIIDEYVGKDQGLNYVALVPSESGLVKILSKSGFPYIYTSKITPDHEDFKATLLRKRRRLILIASSKKIKSELFKEIKPIIENYNTTTWGN